MGTGQTGDGEPWAGTGDGGEEVAMKEIGCAQNNGENRGRTEEGHWQSRRTGDTERSREEVVEEAVVGRGQEVWHKSGRKRRQRPRGHDRWKPERGAGTGRCENRETMRMEQLNSKMCIWGRGKEKRYVIQVVR